MSEPNEIVSAEAFRAAQEAMDAYWQDDSLQRNCQQCHGTGKVNVGEGETAGQDWCGDCSGHGFTHEGTEEGALRAALLASGYPQKAASMQEQCDQAGRQLDESSELLAAAETELTRLRAENAALKADAERYRWLSSRMFGQILIAHGYTYSQIEHWSNSQNMQKLAEVIDTHLAEQGSAEWETGALGRSEQHVRRSSPESEAAVDAALGIDRDASHPEQP